MRGCVGMTVVAIRQRYAGHAKRAALIAAANSYMGRLVVVVEQVAGHVSDDAANPCPGHQAVPLDRPP